MCISRKSSQSTWTSGQPARWNCSRTSAMTSSIRTGRRTCRRGIASLMPMPATKRSQTSLRTSTYARSGPIPMSGLMTLRGSTRTSPRNSKSMFSTIKRTLQGARRFPIQRRKRIWKIATMSGLRASQWPKRLFKHLLKVKISWPRYPLPLPLPQIFFRLMHHHHRKLPKGTKEILI